MVETRCSRVLGGAPGVVGQGPRCRASKEHPPSRTKARPQATQPEPAAPRRCLAPPATLEQRQLDLIGLGLVAAAVFFAFLIYLGWDGGRAGRLGRRRPAAAGRRRPLRRAGGAAGLRRDPRAARRCCPPSGRSAPAGCACSRRCALGLAAGTLGLGPGGAEVRWDPSGSGRAAAWWGRPCTGAPRRALGVVGAHIVAVVPLPGRRAAADRRVGRRAWSRPPPTRSRRTTRDMRAAVQRRAADRGARGAGDLRAAGVARHFAAGRGVGGAEAVLVGRGPLPRPLRGGRADRGRP